MLHPSYTYHMAPSALAMFLFKSANQVCCTWQELFRNHWLLIMGRKSKNRSSDMKPLPSGSDASLKERQKEAARADPSDDSEDNSEWALVEFLEFIEQTVCTAVSGNSTETASASVHSAEPGYSRILPQALRNIEKRNCNIYDSDASRLHKKMWNVMNYDKQGTPKENLFIEWCRKVNNIVEKYNQSANITRDRNEAQSNEATRAASASVGSITIINGRGRMDAMFKSLAFDMLSNDLTPEQHDSDAYQLRYNEATHELEVTTKQRSWINMMLRKNLGHGQVAHFIFNNGIPVLLHVPAAESKPRIRTQLVQQLEQFIYWHHRLLTSIAKGNRNLDRLGIRQRSASDDLVWPGQGVPKSSEACEKRSTGTLFAEQRDTGKRNREALCATEQATPEDVNTRQIHKRRNEACYTRMPSF